MLHLEEGDRLDIGQVAFTFTLLDEEYEQHEHMARIHTLTPRK